MSWKTKVDVASLGTDDAENPYAKEILAWTSYTYYLASFAGFVLLARGIIDRALKDAEDTKNKVDAALKVVYDATQSVDQEFLDGIKDMQEGKKPEYEFPPTPVPDWPQNNGDTIFQAAWQIIQPTLEIWQSKAGGTGPMNAAIAGLLAAGDKCVKILNEAFGF